MTARELRQTLTKVEDQDLTIKELRDILFEVEEQDKELEDGDIIRLTSSVSTCYYCEVDGESYIRQFPANISKSAFFYMVSSEIAMSDCSGVSVTKITYKGVSYQYEGWKPGMLFVYDGEDGSKFEGCYPQLDH